MSKIIACTVITKNRLAFARTLARSLREHNPEIQLYVLLADKVDGCFDPASEPFILVDLQDLPDQRTVEKMCFYYNAFELCCALRALLYEYLFDRTDADMVLFFDSDIMIYHSLEAVVRQMESASILIFPHSMVPVDIKYVLPHEINFLSSGLYNAGFLGLRRTPETGKFIAWFKERLKLYCFNDLEIRAPRGLFVDQKWLMLVPLFFKGVKFLLDPGANLGHWDLFSKKLRVDGHDNITVDGEPLLFAHFSGWDIEGSYAISKYAPMYEGMDVSLWNKLALVYKRELLENGYETTKTYPYAFERTVAQEIITPAMRRSYYDCLKMGTAPGGSPFQNYVHTSGELLPEAQSLDFCKQQLQEAHDTIVAMQASKFWKLRVVLTTLRSRIFCRMKRRSAGRKE